MRYRRMCNFCAACVDKRRSARVTGRPLAGDIVIQVRIQRLVLEVDFGGDGQQQKILLDRGQRKLRRLLLPG